VLFAFQILSADTKTEKATFAGGCFWCMEEPFDKLDGVSSTTSGFANGLEAVEIVYDAAKITYEQLLEVFWKNIDPTNPNGQFCDRGPQYRSAIFYHNEQQKQLAEESKLKIEQTLNKQSATPIVQATEFSKAEDSHQDFYKKNALQYKRYKVQCGRERRLREIWGN
jgi:peptide-methionine (S)-S-oxide reductase